MSPTGLAGAQQYSNEELAAIADEAHRAGLQVAAHAHGDTGHPAVPSTPGSTASSTALMSATTRSTGWSTRHVPRVRPPPRRELDVSHAPPELQAKAAEVFPKAKDAQQGDRRRA